jgi:outer membrane translocation and assembly module TamA
LIPSFFNGNWEFSNQTSGYQKRYAYNRFGVESVGLNFRLGNELFGKKEVDENGSYTIEGIRFAQYLKFENDFRFYTNFSRNQSLANRVDFGYALPYANSKVLPFEKNFFAGGANGIRAWQARSLGPGSYQDTTSLVSYNNLGEVRLTLSSEYRFDLTNILEGAFFIDAGNVWIVDDEDNKEGSEFKSNFISDIAVGGGIGFRFDFDFFLIRLDLGFKLKDPSLDRGEKWFWESKNNYDNYLENLRSKGLTEQESYRYFPNINLGIGYPF